jgi:hypothetical protein
MGFLKSKGPRSQHGPLPKHCVTTPAGYVEFLAMPKEILAIAEQIRDLGVNHA